MKPLILASTSLYRRQLLEKLQLPFEAVAPPYEETAIPGESPRDRALRLAQGKALSLAAQYPDHLIIGSDQVAFLPPDTILSKPGNLENAQAQLEACSGKAVSFYTGLCLYNSASKNLHLDADEFQVHFRRLDQRQILRYLQRERPFDCAGSFKSEGLGISLFSKLSGRDPNSLIGLPLILLVDFLQREGIAVP